MSYWDSFKNTYGALSEGMQQERDAIDRDAQGAAYKTDGWAGVARTAGGQGNFQVAAQAETAAGQADTRTREARTRRMAVFNNVLNGVRSLPYEQRKQRIEQLAPRLMEEGFTQEQIAGYDPTDERITGDLAVAGQLSQYVEGSIKQDESGRWVGQTRDGRVEPIQGAPEPPRMQTYTGPQAVERGFREGSVVQEGPDGSYKVIQAPREFSPNQMGGNDAPSGYMWNQDGGGLAPIPGGPADKPVTLPAGEAIRAGRALSSVPSLRSSVNRFREMLRNADQRTLMGYGEDGAALVSAHRLLALAMKGPAALDLGALVGADFEILNDTIGEPGNIRQLLVQGGKEGGLARLDQVDQFLGGVGDQLRQTYEPYADSEALRQYYQPTSQEPLPVPATRRELQNGGLYQMGNGSVGIYDAASNKFYVPDDPRVRSYGIASSGPESGVGEPRYPIPNAAPASNAPRRIKLNPE